MISNHEITNLVVVLVKLSKYLLLIFFRNCPHISRYFILYLKFENGKNRYFFFKLQSNIYESDIFKGIFTYLVYWEWFRSI